MWALTLILFKLRLVRVGSSACRRLMLSSTSVLLSGSGGTNLSGSGLAAAFQPPKLTAWFLPAAWNCTWLTRPVKPNMAASSHISASLALFNISSHSVLTDSSSLCDSLGSGFGGGCHTLPRVSFTNSLFCSQSFSFLPCSSRNLISLVRSYGPVGFFFVWSLHLSDGGKYGSFKLIFFCHLLFYPFQ